MPKLTGLMRLGRDAEVRYTPSGEPVANLSLAYNFGKRGDDGKRPSQWIDAALWGDRAKSLAEYLSKGSQHLFVIDDVHIESFRLRDGTPGQKLAGRVTDIELGANAAPAPAPAPASRQAAAPRPQSTGSGFDDMDSEIPF